MHLASILTLCVLLSVSPVLADPSIDAATGSSVAIADGSEIVTPTRAADSCGWSVQMEEDEGGPVKVALSCDSDTEFGPAFRLQCGGDINIRYNSLQMGAEPPATSTLMLTSGGQSLSADVVFEEMEGAFAAYVKMGSPIVSLLRTGEEVGVTVKGVDLPSRIVSLKGSTTVIDTLIKSCTEIGAGSNPVTSVFVSKRAVRVAGRKRVRASQ